jgi:TPR repeat protein
VSIDMRSAARYFKLAADQGLAEAECHYGRCLLAGVGLQRDLATAIQYLKLSAAKGSPSGQFVVGWMAENGIGSYVDRTVAVRYYELSCDLSAAGSARVGWCW